MGRLYTGAVLSSKSKRLPVDDISKHNIQGNTCISQKKAN